MQKSKKADFSLQGELKTDSEWEAAMSKEVCKTVIPLKGASHKIFDFFSNRNSNLSFEVTGSAMCLNYT
jgi:hypothetical protein